MRQRCITLWMAALACLASVLGVASPAGAQLAVGQELSERIEVNTVDVEVHVSDGNGRPVTGLRRGDFILLEDGKPMTIANFDAASHRAAEAADIAGPGAPGPPAAAPAPRRDPASWVLYVDDLFLRPANRARILEQLRGFLGRELASGDQVMVVTYDQGLHIRLPFTTDHAALGRALDAVEQLATHGGELERARRLALARVLDDLDQASGGGRKMRDTVANRRQDKEDISDDEGGGGGGQCPAAISEPVKSYAEAVRHEVLSSIGALTVLVNSLSGVPGPKVLLHVSDGIPLNPGEEMFQVLFQVCGGGAGASGMQGSALPVFAGGGSGSTGYKAAQAALDAQTYSTVSQWTAFTAHANAQRVTLYTLQASGLEVSGAGADLSPGEEVLALPEVASIESLNRQQPLSLMASETGGRAVFWANDIRHDLERIQEDLASYYSLGFNPPHTGDGREHRVEVRVKRSGVTLRYRQSYRDKPSLERAVDHTLASLFYGYQDNPLDIRLELGDTAAVDAETWTVPVQLRIPLFKLGLETRKDVFAGRLRVLVAVRDAQGGSSPVRQIEVPIRIPHDQAITALGQFYLYELRLSLKAGAQQVAVAVRDETTTTTSYLARSVQVGEPEKPATR